MEEETHSFSSELYMQDVILPYPNYKMKLKSRPEKKSVYRHQGTPCFNVTFGGGGDLEFHTHKSLAY